MKQGVIATITFLLAFGCSNSAVIQYPGIVGQKHLEELFDLAQFEMYKLNACCDCVCKAKASRKPPEPKDSVVSFLSLRLNLDTLTIQKDTVVFYFSYFSKKYGPSLKYIGIDNYLTGCVHNYAISFSIRRKQPIRCYSSENLVGDYEEEPSLKGLESGLIKCLALEPSPDEWLINYLRKKNALLNN